MKNRVWGFLLLLQFSLSQAMAMASFPPAAYTEINLLPGAAGAVSYLYAKHRRSCKKGAVILSESLSELPVKITMELSRTEDHSETRAYICRSDDLRSCFELSSLEIDASPMSVSLWDLSCTIGMRKFDSPGYLVLERKGKKTLLSIEKLLIAGSAQEDDVIFRLQQQERR